MRARKAAWAKVHGPDHSTLKLHGFKQRQYLIAGLIGDNLTLSYLAFLQCAALHLKVGLDVLMGGVDGCMAKLFGILAAVMLWTRNVDWYLLHKE